MTNISHDMSYYELEGSKLFGYVIAAMGNNVMNVTQVKIKS